MTVKIQQNHRIGTVDDKLPSVCAEGGGGSVGGGAKTGFTLAQALPYVL